MKLFLSVFLSRRCAIDTFHLNGEWTEEEVMLPSYSGLGHHNKCRLKPLSVKGFNISFRQ